MQTLTSAPAEHWGPLLGVLGTGMTLRREAPPEAAAGPCTVTSLLGAMSAMAPAATPAEEPPPRANARSRRRRLAAEASAPKVEDPRDIEELLRDLGEEPAHASTASKGKSKTKPTAKPPQAVAASAPAAAAEVELEDMAAVAPAAGVKDTAATGLAPEDVGATRAKPLAPTPRGVEASIAASSEVDDGGAGHEWRVVPNRTARKAGGRVAGADAVATAGEAQPPAVEVDVIEAAAPGSGHRATQDEAPPTTSGGGAASSLTSAAATPIAEASSAATALCVSGSPSSSQPPASAETPSRPTAPPDASTALAAAVPPLPGVVARVVARVVPNSPEECRIRRSKSVGATPYGAECDGSDEEVPPQDFMKRPSVGTWCNRLQRPWLAEPEPAKRSCSTEAARTSWDQRPSVGSWLRQSPQRGGMTPKRSEAPPEPDTLFSPTPESTPRDAHLSACGSQVVWVPIPVHLLGEVQELLCRDARMSS